ncbi:hypothetical protein [Kurthia gibsonii]|uniref:hypothetical protein n=1 Tax=Kurthia gibsonii TaxID=33946 RepID=UPI002DC03F0A|nr:hypothetical protein [Kurthia gibsonii]MEB7772890.1 hypothetical protein [Kurthia gibsonii]
MFKQFVWIISLVVIGSLSITFAFTRNLEATVFWTIFSLGTICNLVGVLILYITLKKLDSIQEPKRTKL